MVSFQTSEPSAHPVSLRSIDEVKRKPATIYRYAREPIIDRERGIRLIVRGGRLGYEFFPGEPIAGSGPTSVTTCTDSPHRMTEAWEIIVPSGWNDTPLAALQLLPPS